ncbi:hypothetical protein TNCV_1476111 [Trichonephila clavipes]|nr:hypothetical protein TNCV_1476111 [Trichonephila clavipes]
MFDEEIRSRKMAVRWCWMLGEGGHTIEHKSRSEADCAFASQGAGFYQSDFFKLIACQDCMPRQMSPCRWGLCRKTVQDV